MKKVLIGLLFVSNLAYADWTNPFEKFSTSQNFASTVSVTWRPVDNPTQSCSAERAKRGFAQYGGAVDACSFWDGSTCLVITAKVTDRDTVGHEIQHCFQGKWH